MAEVKGRNKFDEAVADFIRTNSDVPGEMVTGWVLAAVVKHPGLPNSDGYIVENSEGMAYHSQLGLLQSAINEKQNIILSQIIKE